MEHIYIYIYTGNIRKPIVVGVTAPVFPCFCPVYIDVPKVMFSLFILHPIHFFNLVQDGHSIDRTNRGHRRGGDELRSAALFAQRGRCEAGPVGPRHDQWHCRETARRWLKQTGVKGVAYIYIIYTCIYGWPQITSFI